MNNFYSNTISAKFYRHNPCAANLLLARNEVISIIYSTGILDESNSGSCRIILIVCECRPDVKKDTGTATAVQDALDPIGLQECIQERCSVCGKKMHSHYEY